MDEREYNPNFEKDLESRINNITSSVLSKVPIKNTCQQKNPEARKNRKRKGLNVPKDETVQPVQLPRVLMEYFRIKKLLHGGKGAIGEFITNEFNTLYSNEKPHELFQLLQRHFPALLQCGTPFDDLSKDQLRSNLINELISCGCSPNELKTMSSPDLFKIYLEIEELQTFLHWHGIPLSKSSFESESTKKPSSQVVRQLSRLLEDVRSEIERLETYLQNQGVNLPSNELSLPQLKQFYHEFKSTIG